MKKRKPTPAQPAPNPDKERAYKVAKAFSQGMDESLNQPPDDAPARETEWKHLLFVVPEREGALQEDDSIVVSNLDPKAGARLMKHITGRIMQEERQHAPRIVVPHRVIH